MKKRLLPLALCAALSTPSYAVTPEQVLANDVNESMRNGVNSRKGSIGALIVNSRILNNQLGKGQNTFEVKTSMNDIRENIVGVKSIGLFEILPLKGWLSDESKPGNILVTVIALQEMPDQMTEDLRNRLKVLEKTASGILKHELKKII